MTGLSRYLRLSLFLVGALCLSLPTIGSPISTTSREVVRPSRLLVRFRDGIRTDRRIALHEKLGGVCRHNYHRFPIEVIQFSEGSDLENLAAAYAARPEVEYAEQNRLWTTCSLPDDPLFPGQWSLLNTGQSGGEPGSDIAAAEAWEIVTGSREVVVAVLDTGIEYHHPDLIANIWVNPAPEFDDLHGARWTDGDGTVTSADPLDDHGHGTHCAGIIGAVGDNVLGITGVSWQVSLMALKCLNNSGSYGEGYTADIIAAIEYGLDHSATVFCGSWGSETYSAALEEVMAIAGAAGSLFVAPAGNLPNNRDTRPYFPACFLGDHIISVAASTEYDHRVGYSAYGPESVDLLSPGSAILSTWTDGTYRSRSGTSAAAAHVAGAAALLRAARPEADGREIREWILGSVDVLPWMVNRVKSAGRLNLAQALSESSALVVNPYSVFQSAGEPGGPFEASSRIYTIRNAGDETLNWTATAVADWLEVSPDAGLLLPGDEVEIEVALSGAAADLPEAIHHSEVIFTDVGRGATRARKVKLNLVTLCRALDNCLLTWTTGGDTGWFGQTGESFDGEAAARSGPIDGGRESWLETTVPGPGCLTFFWKVATSTNCYLEFYIDGVRQDRIERKTDWEWRSFQLEEGIHTLRWRFSKSVSYNAYPDIGWLDQVSYIPEDPLLVTPQDEYLAAGDQGGPFAPSVKTYLLTNFSLERERVEWMIHPVAEWLDIEPVSGGLEWGESVEIAVNLNARAEELLPGGYEDYLNFDNLSNGLIHTRRVYLEVVSIPGRISVEDSIPPIDDRELPFGAVLAGESREETITLRNSNLNYPLRIDSLVVPCYLENFSSGSAVGWEPTVPAQWAVQSGVYRAEDPDQNYFMQSTYGGQLWTDCSFGATLRRVDTRSTVCRMLLRASEDYRVEGSSQGSAYSLGIFDHGQFSMGKQVDGRFRYLQVPMISPYLFPFSGGTANRVLFNIRGERLEVYFNGHLAWSGTDVDISSAGRVGFLPYTRGDSPTEYFFDDITVAENIASSGVESTRCELGLEDPPPADSPFRFSDLPELPLVLAGGETCTFRVAFEPGYESSWEGQLRIGSDDRDDPEVEIIISGTGCADYLSVTEPDGFTADGDQGGPFSPPSRSYSLVNRGPENLDWLAASTEGWLIISPASGTLTAGMGAEVEVRLTETAAALAPGLYAAEISFTNSDTGYTLIREASLNVIAIPGRIVVEDSVYPMDDHRIPFADLNVGDQCRERITIRNTDPDYSLPIFRISLLGSGETSPGETSDPKRLSSLESRKGRTVFPQAEPHSSELLLVRFREDLKQSRRENLHRRLGTRVHHSYRRIPVEVVEIPEGSDLATILAAYEEYPEVEYAEPNYRIFLDAVPDDPRFDELWALRNLGQTGGTPGADISAPAAWEDAVGSSEVIVAVIDTGINYRHRELAGNIWTNPRPTFDDLHGAVWSRGNGTMSSGDPMDVHGHGTHCAGIIGASGNNALGVAGVNWNVRLMALRFLDREGSGYAADAVAALEYAIDHGAHLTSNSWGGGSTSQALEDMIAAAGEAGQIFVAAAGNSGSDNDRIPYHPASLDCPNIVSVAASDHNDLPAYFSNYGRTSVDLAAPGVGILSCWKDGDYQTHNGTSMAAPYVAGAAALLLSLHPDAGYSELKSWILAGADPRPAWEEKTLTGGRLNLARSLNRANPHFLLSDRPSLPISILPGGELSVEVIYQPTEPGEHRSRIRLESADRENPIVEVELAGRGRPEGLLLSPEEPLAAAGPLGGPFDPPEKVYLLVNTGNEPLDWAAGTSATWLTIDPPIGRLEVGETAEVTIGIAAAAAYLSGGTHRDVVVFRDTTTGGARSVSVSLRIEISLCAALDNCDLIWRHSGFDPWFGQEAVTSDGISAAQSGSILHTLDSCLDADVVGPGRLEFSWKVSSEPEYDFLEFYLGGTLRDRISGEGVWREESYEVPPGRHTLRWRYVKDEAVIEGADCGWLDRVVYRPEDRLEILPYDDALASGYQGGAFSPDAFLYTLANNASSALDWEISASGWLAADIISGHLQPGDSIPVEISLTASADELEPGFHRETAVFINRLSGFSQARVCRLEVLPIPGIIGIEDSISPIDDLDLPFGPVVLGESRTERVTVSNRDGDHSLRVDEVALLGGDYSREGTGKVSGKSWSATKNPGGRFPLSTADLASPDTILVRFQTGVRAAARSSIHSRLSGRVRHSYRRVPIEVVELASGTDLAVGLAAYNDCPEVLYAEPNYLWEIAEIPDDPRFSEQWALWNTGQTGGTPGADIGAVAAWEITTGSPEVIVAVVDTGIDYNHPDLASNIWVNPDPAPDLGDLHGARWTSGNGMATSGDPMDGQGHGSHCAGVIGALGNNAQGVTGLNWRVRLMALKFLSDSGSGYTADALSALEYAIDHGAHLTSNSWGGGEYSRTLEEMIAAAGESGQLFIASAGNSGGDNDSTPTYPASYDLDNIISVANSNHQDLPGWGTCYGKTSVDLAAPGESILSTVIDGGYALMSGTSMAGPQVAGTAALILSLDPGAAPELVKGWILAGTDPLPAWEGLTVTGGRLNAGASLRLARPHFHLRNLPELPLDLEPGEEFNIDVVYQPQETGCQGNWIRIRSNDRFRTEVEVRLSGYVPTPPLPPTPSSSPTPTVGPSASTTATPTSTPACTPSPRVTASSTVPLPTPVPTGTLFHLVLAGRDYNGDGRDDLPVWNSSRGAWVVSLGRFDECLREYYGREGDLPTPGDYDGDGTTDLAIFREASGLWAVRGLTRVYFGRRGDIPAPADYRGEGTTDPAIFRSESGLWGVRGLTRAYFGQPGDLPVPGLYGGTGAARFAVYRPASGLWAVRGSFRCYFGSTGDDPLPLAGGEVDGGVGIFRESSGLWAIRGVTRFYYGRRGDYPRPGDYRGMGGFSPAIYRPDLGLWAIRGLTRSYCGGPGALPL